MSSEDNGDTSSIGSSEDSFTSDESFKKSGGRRPIVKKYINISNNNGQVAVASRSAKILYHPQPTDGSNVDLSQREESVSPVTMTDAFPSKDDSEHDQEENVARLSEPIPRSYCLSKNSTLVRYTEKKAECDPRPSRGIIIHKRDEDGQWSTEWFFENPDRFIQKMDISADFCKEQMEEFILTEILPHLEQSWGRCPSSNEDVYKILAKISRSINSGTVVRHALQLLFHLICKDDFGSANDNLLVVEGVIRTSIFSPEGMFAKDEHSEGNLKLFLYSRILSLLLMQKVRQDELPIVERETVLKNVHEELRNRCDQLKNKKKDRFRYSMEFILHTITRLLKPHEKSIAPSKLKGIIKECKKFCGSSKMESKDLNILRTLQKKKTNDEWIDLHCILIYLHGKVHSERPVPQMDSERRAMKLIRLITEAYLTGGGGGDWRFCLLASSVLVDIAKNNMTKEMRKEAGGCLVYLLKDAKVQKRPECRALLEQRSSELLFCPDNETRTFLVHFLSKNQNSEDKLTSNLLIEHLSSMYRRQTLEISKTTVHQGPSCFIKRGMFQRRKVAVKVLHVMKDHLLKDDPEFQARKQLIREVDNMKRLTASPHPNFPVLLGYDTKSFPYHLITEYEKWGNLLQFVRMSREREPHLKPTDLLKMLINISDALVHLEALGLVHRSVMAENVLVGENFVCKLTGLHSLRQLTNDTYQQDVSLALLDGYCSAEVPEYVSTSNEDDDLPVRWKAPECLKENRYSPTSDVWAFGVLMCEVLTYGCTPYRHVFRDDEVPPRVVDRKEIVPREACFEYREYELMKQCCEWQPHRRPKLSEINQRLREILQHTEGGKSRPGPPPLEIQQTTYGSPELQEFQDEEELYSSISEECKESISQDQDIYEEVRDDLLRKDDQGSTMIWERISQEDDQHVKRLVSLNNPNLASIWIDLDSHYWIITPERPNLKEFVLDRRCKREDIVMFLSQVASALHYLHVNHIVHGDLRAEYVNVVAPDKVQVGRLGRSRSLTMSAYEVTSTSCVVETAMPPDSTRWSAPEVILDGHYTHASDVWAFGILAWELCTSYTTGQEWRQCSVPYHDLYNHEILPYMREKGPLVRPEGCPDWVYIIMHQCWPFDSTQRPPFLAIVDCLTSRQPMKSWIMQLWLKSHDESEWPDLSICQPNDAFHVLDAEKHPSKQNIERMCSEDFFARHDYRYVGRSVVEGYDKNRASCSPKERPQVSKSFGNFSESEEPYSNPRNEGVSAHKDDTSGYLCPLEMKDINERTTMSASERCRNEIYQAENSSKTGYEATIAEINHEEDGHHHNSLGREDFLKDNTLADNCATPPECQNKARKPSLDNCTIHQKTTPNRPEDGKIHGIYQNLAYKVVPEDCVINDKPLGSTSENTAEKNRLYENRLAALKALNKSSLEEGKRQTSPLRRLPARRRIKIPGTQPNKQTKWQLEDKENFYENTSSAQWVSPNKHVYENVEMEVETGNSNMEGGCVEKENQPQEEHESETNTNHEAGEDIRNSTLMELANNPRINIFYV